MFTCFRRSESDQTTDLELPLLIHEPCLFCKVTIDHKNEVKKIVRKARNHQKIDIENFYTTPIVHT